jgi:hypothetical protein
MKNEFILMTLFFVLIIGSALLWSAPEIQPYSFKSTTPFGRTQTPYKEGFDHAIDYTSTNTYQPVDYTYNGYSIAPTTDVYTRTQDGVFGSPDASEKIDLFSGLSGSAECSNGSGLTNSRGHICLPENHYKLLTTRGGNASSGDSQIA